MAENKTPENKNTVQLETGTYEIIRKRLDTQAQDLRQRLSQLNDARKEVFGAIETTLIANNRITTIHNCIPRDMIAIGERFIFGYNVHLGLKAEIDLSDIFSVFRFDHETHSFQEESLALIQNNDFEAQLKELYKYYKEAKFSKFAIIGPHLFIVFKVGKSIQDIKTFKWLIAEDALKYLDNRSDHEFQYPVQQEFEWKKTVRDWQRNGKHPHISINDRIFVETVGGDLTIKIEDNTDTGEGIYSELVEQKEQALDDAEFYYADLGNLILLKIKPYKETKYRYFVFNEKLKQVNRIDKIEEACILLPDNQGIIFSNGYYLQSGILKIFDNLLDNMVFEKRMQAPNGEDCLFIFHNREEGVYILLSYNLIEQKVESPIVCHGFSLFEQGELAYFKATEEPTKNHLLQVWQTPYVSPDFISPVSKENFLYKIGNKDIVHLMADVNEVLNLVARENIYATLYQDLVKKSTSILDAYPWLNSKETFQLNEPLKQTREAASGAIDEFDKVTRVMKSTQEQLKTAEGKIEAIVQHIKSTSFSQIDAFVKTLANLRGLRGEAISLKELRYTDLPLIEGFEKILGEQTHKISEATVRFLLQPTALDFYQNKIQAQKDLIEKAVKVTELSKIEEEIDKAAKELDLLIDIVSNLKIDDSTHTTQIIENISTIYATLNQIRAEGKNKKKSLQSVEAVAEFNVQIKLISQSIINYLDIADTAEKTEEYLTKIMVQIQELEGKFADFDEFIGQLTQKREEVYNAFESKKLALIEAKNKKANTLVSAADRILKGIKGKIATFNEVSEINGYFASDLMIEKIRDLVKNLVTLNDSVKADEIQGRLKSLREDAIRQLKDKKEMFVAGENVIKLGKHNFSVNTQNLDVTIVLKDAKMYYHLTGTGFFEEVKDPAFLETQPVWEQNIISENEKVYAGEYLAFSIYRLAMKGGAIVNEVEVPNLQTLQNLSLEALTEFVQKYASLHYNYGYVKGIHNVDAGKILKALIQFNTTIDLLRYPTQARACAKFYWKQYVSEGKKELLYHQLKGIGIILKAFPHTRQFNEVIEEIKQEIRDFIQETKLFESTIASYAGEYLFYEITRADTFISSAEAALIYKEFISYLKKQKYLQVFEKSLETLQNAPIERFEMIREWVYAFVNQEKLAIEFVEEFIDEATSLLFFEDFEEKNIIQASLKVDLGDMVGNHAVLQNKIYHLHYNDFILKLNEFERVIVPLYQQFVETKKKLTSAFRDEVRLDEFKPKVLTSFVRNKLIDTVYLPLIGDNLAKQIGVVGENKRTDLMGMLLLISPPGYGKTTLMEYICSRLGLIFMKINGPAIGHKVTSVDPNEAPNASAREEINKLNLAFEMGDNVMIYIDDIQHCNPEFLQKFISLADGQRKIEGTYKGKSKTYDLRGKKVVIAMAGNPYTESGEKFKIPDMLANRADTYNLGDIIGDTREAFELSYIENSLTSNVVLSKLASKNPKDLYALVRIAQTDSREGITLEGNYASEEINEYVSVLKKMFVVRDYILRNNLEYIRSAAQSDDFRTEPSFKLQGSYRNMNKIAEKLVPIMNDQELKTLLLSHYTNESQTLTTGAEANMLKFKELNGLLSDAEAQRWEEIKTTFRKNQKFKNLDTQNQVGQVVAQMVSFNDGLVSIKDVLESRLYEQVQFTEKLEKLQLEIEWLKGKKG